MSIKTLQSHEDIKVKALDDGSVYLEGWANKAVVDRGNDLIGKKAWKLDNYKKNAIILFNHDHSKPIGKMISVEAKDEGLFVKGRISNSKDPEISRIRDLVKEGILNSLSVGMMVRDEERKDSVNVIKDCELHEVSIVAVPMNQDSVFSVSTKSLAGSMLDTMEIITGAVGRPDVEKACKKLHDGAEYQSIDEIADRLAEVANVEKETALDFLRMKSAETPAEIKEWLDTEAESKPQVDSDEDVFAISVSKSAVESIEELIDWAQKSGWKADNVTEAKDYYLLVQKSSSLFKDEDLFSEGLQEVDMGDGVKAYIGKLKSAEDKGLLDDEMPGHNSNEKPANEGVDQSNETKVLLTSIVTMLEKIADKLDKLSPEAKPDVQEPREENLSAEQETEFVNLVNSFVQKTNERLSRLGL